MEFDHIAQNELADVGAYCKETMETILEKMDFKGTVTPNIKEDGRMILQVSDCLDMGLIIGKDGNTLRALQTILRVLVMKKFSKKAHILLDADNYLLKREEALKDTAYAAVERVEKTRRKVQLKPMNSVERRIIHMTLQDEPNIHTYSIGEGQDRRIVIAPGSREQNDAFQNDAQPNDALAPSYQDAQ